MSVEITRNEVDDGVNIFDNFKELGCCDYCCLRFTGQTLAKAFTNYSVVNNGRCTDSENGTLPKLQKLNPCLACLGILQSTFIDETHQKILSRLKEEGYESNSFNLAITLPICCQIRAQSLWFHIVERFPHLFKSLFPFGCVSISPKDVIKWLLAPRIQEGTSMKFEPKSDFVINVSIDYASNKKECSGLFKLFPETFKSHKKRGESSISRKAVDDVFNNSLYEDDFRQEYTVPPPVPDSYATLGDISFAHNAVYVAGRYGKYSRQLPQTPWIVGAERKMESSVQEKITGPLEKLFKTTVSKFGASGREDVDVRMLGRGRPFTVELINPKKTKHSAQQLRQLQAEINRLSFGQISVRDLQLVPKSSLIDLKAGEESKCKIYLALCAVTTGFREKLKGTIGKAPLELDQSTPVRVLHRRPVATRKRTVYTINIIFPETRPSPVEGTELFYLEVKTQAGTYVKEFVHGDMGRTRPSLRSLTGAPFIDILALDVTDVELNWPPPVSDED